MWNLSLKEIILLEKLLKYKNWYISEATNTVNIGSRTQTSQRTTVTEHYCHVTITFTRSSTTKFIEKKKQYSHKHLILLASDTETVRKIGAL